MYEMLSIGHRLKFYKTNNNRRVIGRINDFAGNFKYHSKYKYASISDMNVIYENGIINTTPIELTINNKRFWTSPIEEMRKILKTALYNY